MSVHARLTQWFAIVLVLCLGFGTAAAEKGQFSIGGNFGVGFYSGGSYNDSLSAAGLKKVSDGWEYGPSLRYGVSPKLSLDVEALSINGKGTTTSVDPKFQAEVNGIAVPLNLYYELSSNDTHAFSLFGGAGPMLKTGWSTKQDETEANSMTKTGFYGHAGVEAQWKPGRKFAFTTRALARMASAKDVALDTDPATTFDVSMNGVALGVGARLYFGGSGN